MTEEKLLTVREVSIMLGVSEKEVIDLAESGAMPAYKVGGVYLRFKKEQVEDYQKNNLLPQAAGSASEVIPFKERFSDFLYFNDFYIAVAVVMVLLILVIFLG